MVTIYFSIYFLNLRYRLSGQFCIGQDQLLSNLTLNKTHSYEFTLINSISENVFKIHSVRILVYNVDTDNYLEIIILHSK